MREFSALDRISRLKALNESVMPLALNSLSSSRVYRRKAVLCMLVWYMVRWRKGRW